MLAESRRRAIVELVRAGGAVTIADLEARFEVSPVTVRRDLAELERHGVVARTHGGAVLPAIRGSVHARAGHEDSFAQRLQNAPDAKRHLADAAVAEIEAGQSVFLDSSTTSYAVAQRVLMTDLRVTLVTNSLPIMQLVASPARTEVELIGVGGTLRPITGSFVGPVAVRTIAGHFADQLFLSVKGVTQGGVMTEADTLEAEVKAAMIAQATTTTLLVDPSKLAARGLGAVAPVSQLSAVFAYGIPRADLESLEATDVILRTLRADLP
jgi:DeoR/GlpR family transcriptional regulator of sugar metabolism